MIWEKEEGREREIYQLPPIRDPEQGWNPQPFLPFLLAPPGSPGGGKWYPVVEEMV